MKLNRQVKLDLLQLKRIHRNQKLTLIGISKKNSRHNNQEIAARENKSKVVKEKEKD